MPSPDYTNAIGGGLKLKGAAKPSGVEKKKSKKKKASKPRDEGSSDRKREDDGPAEVVGQTALQKALADEEEGEQGSASAAAQGRGAEGKTETQKRHEEMRRKRLDERLKKEGIKTHKERVEELNKYLSRLSEHHDMPKIGPG